MPRHALRFAFTIAEGQHARLSCSGWRLWVHGDDTYITTKNLGGIWKASLHGDSAWRVAITRENAESRNPMYPGPGRAPWTFEPTSFHEGRRLAFAIAVARGSLMPQELDGTETQIRVEDRWDQLTIAYVWMTEPNVRLATERLVGGPLPLRIGRQVWLTAGTERLPAIDPEPVPISQMIEPLTPETDGVNAPGFVVRGVHLDR